MAKVKRQLKVAEKDAELPRTRRELFGRILKEDFYLIVDLSLVELLFSLPLAATLLTEYVFLINVEVTFEKVFPIVFYMGLILIPCFGLKYVGRNACFSVMKKRVHNEGCFITPQIAASIKQSGAKSLVNGLIAGLSAFIAAVGSVYLLFVAETFWKWTGVGVLILQFAICYGAAEFYCAGENFYDLKFSAQWKNSFYFSVMSFPVTLLYFAATVGLKFVFSLFSVWLAMIVAAAYLLAFNGASVAAATLYAHHKFDIYINRENYPEYVNKGLLKSDEVE